MPTRIIRLAVLLGCLASLTATRAEAHAILVDSVPPLNGTLKAGPEDLQFRYNSRIDRSRSRLLLMGEDRTKTTVIPISPDGPPDVIRFHLDLPPGSYTIRWQVLAIDGHITRGDVPFTVTGP